MVIIVQYFVYLQTNRTKQVLKQAQKKLQINISTFESPQNHRQEHNTAISRTETVLIFLNSWHIDNTYALVRNNLHLIEPLDDMNSK